MFFDFNEARSLDYNHPQITKKELFAEAGGSQFGPQSYSEPSTAELKHAMASSPSQPRFLTAQSSGGSWAWPVDIDSEIAAAQDGKSRKALPNAVQIKEEHPQSPSEFRENGSNAGRKRPASNISNDEREIESNRARVETHVQKPSGPAVPRGNVNQTPSAKRARNEVINLLSDDSDEGEDVLSSSSIVKPKTIITTANAHRSLPDPTAPASKLLGKKPITYMKYKPPIRPQGSLPMPKPKIVSRPQTPTTFALPAVDKFPAKSPNPPNSPSVASMTSIRKAPIPFRQNDSSSEDELDTESKPQAQTTHESAGVAESDAQKKAQKEAARLESQQLRNIAKAKTIGSGIGTRDESVSELTNDAESQTESFLSVRPMVDTAVLTGKRPAIERVKLGSDTVSPSTEKVMSGRTDAIILSPSTSTSRASDSPLDLAHVIVPRSEDSPDARPETHHPLELSNEQPRASLSRSSSPTAQGTCSRNSTSVLALGRRAQATDGENSTAQQRQPQTHSRGANGVIAGQNARIGEREVLRVQSTDMENKNVRPQQHLHAQSQTNSERSQKAVERSSASSDQAQERLYPSPPAVRDLLDEDETTARMRKEREERICAKKARNARNRAEEETEASEADNDSIETLTNSGMKSSAAVTGEHFAPAYDITSVTSHTSPKERLSMSRNSRLGLQAVQQAPILRGSGVTSVYGSSRALPEKASPQQIVTRLDPRGQGTDAPSRWAKSNVSGAFSINRKPDIDTSVHITSVQKADHGANTNHRRNTSPITAADVQVLLWREQGLDWLEIVSRHARLTGAPRARETLRKRHKQVRDALMDAGVSAQLRQEVAEGKVGAETKLNYLMSQMLGSTVDAAAPRSQSAALPALRHPGTSDPGHFDATTSAVQYESAGVPKSASLFVTSSTNAPEEEARRHVSKAGYTSPSPGSSTSAASTTVEHQDEGLSTQRRSTTAGKTFSFEVMQAYLQSMEEYRQEKEDGDAEVEAAREASPMADEDYCHFAYQVERRECTAEQMEAEGIIIDELPWIAVGRAYDNASKAAISAEGQLPKAPPGKPSIIGPDQLFDTRRHLSDDGKRVWTLETTKGIVQMRVRSFLRTFQDGILPEGKEGWMPKTVYFVRMKSAKRAGDDVFEEQTESLEEKNVDDTVYTSRELANERAIDEWLDLTFTSTSARLDVRQLERKEAQSRMLQELDAGGGDGLFKKTAKDDKQMIEVWVNEGRLDGPRNL